MLKIAALVTLSVPIMLIGLLATSSCVIVDVQQADGPRILVPVPLALARAALTFAPEETRHVDIPELAEYSDVAGEIIDELLDAPDGVLVEVHDGNDHVLISKVGDEIEIDVDSDDEVVSIQLPLEAVAEILDSYDGDELETRKVLAALSSVSRTDLVHVRTEDEEVRIYVW